MRTSLLFLLLLMGCSVGMRHAKPQVCMCEEWGELEGEPYDDNTPDLARWWERFGDPQLNQLIDCAIQGNPDLFIAFQRIEEARAQRRIESSFLWPTIDGFVSGMRTRESPNSPLNGFQGARTLIFEDYQVGLLANWEIDLFGRIRSRIRAAGADLCADVNDYFDVMVVLLADVASNYVELRGLQNRIVVANKNIETQGETVEVTRIRFEAGLTSQLDLLEATTLYNRSVAAVITFEEQMYSSIHRLGTLIGCDSCELEKMLIKVKPIPMPPLEIPAGTPCDLFLNRPDIRARWYEVLAEGHRVNVRVADLYPRLSFDAIFSMDASKPKQLVNWTSRSWDLAGQLVQPLFNAGRLRAEVRAENARYHQAVGAYKRTILEALEEVRNSLVNNEKEWDRFDALEHAREAAVRSRDLSQELYKKGLADFLRVLIAERAVIEVEDELVESETRVAQNAIALYKALGGGWQCE